WPAFVTGRKRETFEQDAAELGAIEQNVVRPFEREAGLSRAEGAQRLDRGDAGDEAELRRALGRDAVAQNETCMEIAGDGNPVPAEPSASPALPGRDDP